MRSPRFDKRTSGRTLLIVEDDADTREAFDVLLSADGFRVAGCSNGREALDWLHASPAPDVIVLDLMMPVMDGWQFRVTQKSDPKLAAIPVVAISADATAKAAAIDADAYLKKPVDYEVLVDAIDRLLVASEHRELQAKLAQTDRLTSLGTLAAGVAHEINNPLTYVLLNLEYVNMELPKILASKDHDVIAAIDHVRDGAERIRDIVRSLKTFSRPENETLAPLDVAQVLEATLAMISNEIRHQGRLVKEYTPAPPVLANEARLGQVFLNLLLNAVQSLPARCRDDNEIRVILRAPAPDRVVVEVRDNGAGIGPQIRDRIFEPFFTTKPVGIGTGLGLSICLDIVTSLGGTIAIESEEGRGSTFIVDLPAAHGSTAAGAGERAGERAGEEAVFTRTNRASGHILVIDDEPILCSSLERLLSNEGHVIAATSAPEGLAHIEAGERFDVILCDLLMPDMDASAMYDVVAKIDPAQAERMVFLTGGAFTARARDFLARVPNSRLSKPLDVDALVGLVRSRMASRD
jgi:signal transduction histidine kinase